MWLGSKREESHTQTVTSLLEAGSQPIDLKVMQITSHTIIQFIDNYSHLPNSVSIKRQMKMSAVPFTQSYWFDDFEKLSGEYLSQAVEVIESTHLAAITVDASPTATFVDLSIQFNSNGPWLFSPMRNAASFSYK